MYIKITTLLVLVLTLSACGKPEATVDGRWYTQEQVQLGQTLFKNNCASCHGEQAQGLAADWKQPLADGSYPPPPLNGSAHAWHHPLSVLKRTIAQGGLPLGGKMPAFAQTLNEQEQLAAIAFFQSLWRDEIYQAWLQRGGPTQ